VVAARPADLAQREAEARFPRRFADGPFVAPRVVVKINLHDKTIGLLCMLAFAAAAALSSCTCGPEPTGKPNQALPQPPPPRPTWLGVNVPERPVASDAVLERGATIYKARCSHCHGDKGDGDGPAARFLTTKPRVLSGGNFNVKSTEQGKPPLLEDLFRTVTAGFPAYGMPSFAHLTNEDRWAVVLHVKTLSKSLSKKRRKPVKAIAFGRPPATDAQTLEIGKKAYKKIGCDKCHGVAGRGDGGSANNLKDQLGAKILPRDLTRPDRYKVGTSVEAIYRTLVTGMIGTPMPSHQGVMPESELWALAYYVADMARQGGEQLARQWEQLEAARQGSFSTVGATVVDDETNWDPAASKKYEQTDPEQARTRGCLSCHEGIAVINEKMQPHLEAIGGGPGRGCVVCHEGNADGATKAHAHAGMFPNPGSMWVVGLGKGCAKCHSNNNALSTLQTLELPHPVGGSIMQVSTTATDPSGNTGSNHVYRMQRGLMALEFGKASHTLMSNGVVPKGQYRYADFNMDDPDGAVPTVGSDAYREWIAKALDAGYIERVERSEAIPDFEHGKKLWGDEVKASFADYYRKECGRCHIWGEGRRKRGDLRAGGCAACHVLYTNDGRYEGSDPTIPAAEGKIHPIRHEITTKVPAEQCNHCHTRGKRIGTTYVGAFEFDYKSDGKGIPFNDKGDPQDQLYTKEYLNVRPDVHFERGMDCVDCHTSIDVHGDGNIYPTTLYQVEIQCQDCHGTPQQYPWELPVGYGHQVVLDGQRGVFDKDGKPYLLSSRGNALGNVWRDGEDRAILVTARDGKEHRLPLLKQIRLDDAWKTKQGHVAMDLIPQHLDKLECYSCHSTWAPQCYGCHTKYDRREKATDWVLTALNHDPHSGKQRITQTLGKVTVENRSFLRWEEPMLGINLKGRVSPVIPGCQVFWTYIDENGQIQTLNATFTTDDGFASPTMAPVQPHANTLTARTCESCHTNPKTIGYGTSNSRSHAKLEGDKPLFQDLSAGLFGDIRGSKTGRWQVAQIPGFPYALDQLVTRGGKQVQNMPHLKDRPLNESERNKVEREGLCIACHQHYGKPAWKRVRARLRKTLGTNGRALTPAQHDKAVEEALLSLGR